MACSTLTSCEQCVLQTNCFACEILPPQPPSSSSAGPISWQCLSKGAVCANPVVGNRCPEPSSSSSSEEFNLILVLFVVAISLLIGLAISYAQLKSWFQSDRRVLRKYTDEDERLVLYEHPDDAEQQVEMT